MTFLQLVNRLRIECGVSGDDLTTLAGVTKEKLRLKNWVAQAYVEIQLERMDWDWKRKSITFNTVASQQSYQVGSGLDIDVSDFGNWLAYSFRGYLASAGTGTEILLPQYLDYSLFRDRYLYGSQRDVEGRPLYVTINPANKAVVLWPTPNDVYTIPCEYYATIHELSVDADEPQFPARYHMAVVYKAMMHYGMFEVATEQLEAGKMYYAQIINRMLFDQTPVVQRGGSLI